MHKQMHVLAGLPLRENKQPIETRARSDGWMLDVVDIWRTIQGEGPFAGRPAVFIRLAGCNMRCPGCDTDYTSNRKMLRIEDIRERVDQLSLPFGNALQQGQRLVVLTGGEPMRQSLGNLVRLLGREGYHVQIETNGTLFDETLIGYFGSTTIVCSPKGGKIHPSLEPTITAYKYVLEAGKVDPVDGLPTDVLHSGVRPARPYEGFRGTIYLQPCDDDQPIKNAANTQAVVESCLKFGYTVCLQLHKIVGLP